MKITSALAKARQFVLIGLVAVSRYAAAQNAVGSAFATEAGGAANSIPFDSRTWHLETSPKPHRIVRMHDTVKDFQGRIVYQVPPNDPCQKIFATSMTVTFDGRPHLGELAYDTSPFHKPILYVDVPAPTDADVDVSVDVQFFDTRLVLGPPKGPAPMISGDETEAYTADYPIAGYSNLGVENEQERAWLKDYMSQNGLTRNAREDSLAYAARALHYLGTHFEYRTTGKTKLPDYLRQYGEFGRLMCPLQERSGECWLLSLVYTAMLRESNIPVRHVSGNWVGGGHHVRCLAWIGNLGWVPIDPSSECQDADAHGNCKHLGYWGGDYLSGNADLGIHVPFRSDATFFFNYATFDTVMYLHDDRRVTLAGGKYQ